MERIYEKGDRFDIIYLDIEMSGKNGIEAAKSIRRLDRDVLLIYVSSYETYFMQLFEVEPFRFIKNQLKRQNLKRLLISHMRESLRRTHTLSINIIKRLERF